MRSGSRINKRLVGAVAALALLLPAPAMATVVNPLPGEDETVHTGVPHDDATVDPSAESAPEEPAAVLVPAQLSVRSVGKTAVFTWAAVAGKHKYQLRISRANSASHFGKWKTVKSCQAKVSKLKHGATYQAQVRVKGHKQKATLAFVQP